MSMIYVRTGADCAIGPAERQQDNFLIGASFIVIADGVSGAPDSEVAARVTVDTYASVAKHTSQPDLIRELLAAPSVVATRLAEQGEAGLSTVAAAVIDDNGWLWLTHLGDSQLLVLRDSSIGYLSRPHNSAVAAAELGRLAGTTAHHAITRYLGAGYEFVPCLTCWPLQPGDQLIATTDGVHEILTVPEIIRLAGTIPEPQKLAETIVATALQKGISDNATCATLTALVVGDQTEARVPR
jgi:serine/threonine protein phosphatase PrpC